MLKHFLFDPSSLVLAFLIRTLGIVILVTSNHHARCPNRAPFSDVLKSKKCIAANNSSLNGVDVLVFNATIGGVMECLSFAVTCQFF